ncbi:MAG TPA: hypothetical protein VJN18_30695 [Polyangiaceae bacterium]|nr:hypothetical protein [Polyangiaceae bacterium]
MAEEDRVLLKPKFLLVAAAGVWLPILAVSACTGGEFAGSNAEGGGGASIIPSPYGSGGKNTQGQSGSVGTDAGTGVTCGGPEDCNDEDECTVDLCNADGMCDTSPKCSGTEKCCAGDCAECCVDADCDDGVACTDNTCFASQCMYVPNDTLCDAGQYCSTTDGCRAKQVCGLQGNGENLEEVCADESLCTSDACVENFCKHDFCINGTLCCDTGCEEDCCIDSQCNSDDDPCTVGSCSEGQCSLVPLCGTGEQCCPSADGRTATCGSCCSLEDCNDDVACTEDHCGGGQCSNTPNDTKCPGGYYCDPASEPTCRRLPDCDAPGDCMPAACQTNPRCEGGVCKFDGCANNTKCCPATGECALCCSDAECTDNIACTKDVCGSNGCSHTPDNALCHAGQLCDAQLGCVACRSGADCDDGLPCTTDLCNGSTCQNVNICDQQMPYCTIDGCLECQYDSDCQGGVIAQAMIPPGEECIVGTCQAGTCKDTVQYCTGLQYCCPPFGCAIQCGIGTDM